MDLNSAAFMLLAGLLATYLVLDGFDLGVGVLSLLARSKRERDLYIASVGPCWDGNEVWLLTSGNVLFAAFPAAFGTLLSGFYGGVVLALFGIVARGVAIEFRSMHPSARWLASWDLAFGGGSLLVVLLLGLVAGNVLRGVPIGPDFAWQGSFVGLLNPYALLFGVASCSFFVMHGALYLRGKTAGELRGRLGRIALRSYAAFLVLYAVTAAATLWAAPSLFRKAGPPLFWAMAVLLAAALAAIPLATRAGRTRTAFAASSATIALLAACTAHAAYPVLLPSSLGAHLSLTIYNAASKPSTLLAMLVVAGTGLPIVVGYTVFMYRIFSGPVRVEHEPPAGQEAASEHAAA